MPDPIKLPSADEIKARLAELAAEITTLKKLLKLIEKTPQS